ncbi:MAG: pitrilysin family protein [Myxococcota bacterium]
MSPLAWSIWLSVACTPEKKPMSLDPLAERPTIEAPAAFSPAEPQPLTLDNGIELWLLERPDLPLVSLRMLVDGGASEDPAHIPGLASMTDAMLTHGAGDRDAAAFASFVEQQAISLGVSTGALVSVAYLDAHTERLDIALDLFADMIRRPQLNHDDLLRVRGLHIGALQQTLDDPRSVAPDISSRVYFGASHPIAHPEIGTEVGLNRITVDDLRASWQQRFVPNRARLVVVGAVDADALTAALNARFTGWVAGEDAADVPPPAGVNGGPRLILVDNPDASQSILRVVMPGWTADDPERVAGELATIAIGGTFTSRLNQLMREEKGYTYGASVRANISRNFGTLIASSSVNQPATAEALQDMLAVIKSGHDGFSVEELDRARESNRTDFIEAMGTRSRTAAILSRLVQQGLPTDGLRTRLDDASAVTPEAMQAAWSTRANLDRALILIVGDLSVIQQSVEAVLPGPWQVVPREFPTPDDPR